MKKFLSILMAIVLTMSITIPAFAAETYTITIENSTEGHTYEAYRIFKGDLHEKVLSNIVWGEGQTTHEPDTDAKADAAALKTEADAEALAQSLTLGTVAGTSTRTAEGTYVIKNLQPGYYIIKDATDSLNNKNDAYTKFIVKIVENATAKPKSAQPTVDKKVLDEFPDRDTMSTDGWGETADHAINEVFQYKLIASIPNTKEMEAYKKYKLVFHDTMSAGITFDSIDSVKVIAADKTETIIEKKDDAANPNGYDCNAAAGQAGDKFEITIADLLKNVDNIKGATVEAVYNAHLNRNAELSAEGNNINKVYLEYSNNPNVGGENNTGRTTEDMVWVFTLTMENKKIDGKEKSPLAGAGFRLYDATGAEVALFFDTEKNAYRPVAPGESGVEMKSAEGTGIFNIIGVDAGTYTLEETTTPASYNKCNDLEIVLAAVHSDNPINPATASCTITKSIDGKFANNFEIENNKGAVLPETGGTGTVIFYVLGGILVAGAVIFIITRRRMAAEE